MSTVPAIQEPQGLALSPSPMFRGAEMVRALGEYRDLQHALDVAMPEQLMTLDGRPFRKKGYWRAIAVAFNLTVEPITDAQAERSVVGTLDDSSDNYVYAVAYRATAQNGRSAIGDGACSAAEKQKGRMKATEHNVRSHAHTRAWNRAVSNLVGFGEVSAEEVDREEHGTDVATTERRGGGSALVASVDVKTGTGKGGKAWTMYLVHFDDGREGSTFDEGLKHAAEAAQTAGLLVIPKLEQSGKYVNLTGLVPVGEQAAEPAEQGDLLISDKQGKMLQAVIRGSGWGATEQEQQTALHDLLGKHQIAHVKDIPVALFDDILNLAKAGPKK